MNDFEIDLQDVSPGEPVGIAVPDNYLTVGKIAPDDPEVYIRQNVYDSLEDLSSRDKKHEQGSILVGEYKEEQGKIRIIISDFIEAKYADATSSSLTFTHETWDYVNEEMASKYPDKRIIGWQHTHPGYGVFLSEYDLFIQDNFFDLPFQVAYVIDPVFDHRGFFCRKNGKTEKLGGYNIYDAEGKNIKRAFADALADDEKTEKGAGSTSGVKIALPIIAALLALLCAFSFVLLEKYASLSERVDSQMEEQIELEKTVSRQNETIERQSEEIESLQKMIADGETGEDDGIAGDETATPQNDGTVTDQTEGQTAEDADPDEERVSFIVHTVRSGETLSDICGLYGIDFAEFKSVILSINGIDDPNVIREGQRLLIPVSDRGK